MFLPELSYTHTHISLISTVANTGTNPNYIKKLPELLRMRRENATLFREKFETHPWADMQQEIGESAWFGFAMILNDNAPLSRDTLVAKLIKEGVDCRPVVSGNFLKNEVLRYYDYDLSGSADNAERIEKSGFFVGNHHFSLKEEIEYLYRIMQ